MDPPIKVPLLQMVPDFVKAKEDKWEEIWVTSSE